MFVLDTNVVSELRKASAGMADPNVAAWAGGVAAGSLFLSAISVLELELGAPTSSPPAFQSSIPGRLGSHLLEDVGSAGVECAVVVLGGLPCVDAGGRGGLAGRDDDQGAFAQSQTGAELVVGLGVRGLDEVQLMPPL